MPLSAQNDNPALQGHPAELRMTLEITRAATGLTETVELVGYVNGLPQPDKAADESED